MEKPIDDYVYLRFKNADFDRIKRIVEQYEKQRVKMRERSQAKSSKPRGARLENILVEDVTQEYKELINREQQIQSLLKNIINEDAIRKLLSKE